MIIFPAVDLQGGKAVRLHRGLADQSTIYNDDPVAAALHWQMQGAEWLHLIDLDGAFQGKSVNAKLVAEISEALEIPIELGGGVRDEDAARMWFDAGVERLIIGTMALENPKEYARLCKLFPGKIGVSLDAVDGHLKTRGWVTDAGLTIDEVLPRLVRYRNTHKRFYYEPGAMQKDNDITPEDIKWLMRFKKDVAGKRDPISLYLKKARSYAFKKKATTVAIVVLVLAVVAAVTALVLLGTGVIG